MSYEGDMLVSLAMPERQAVADALIKTLFRHNGTVKEFSSNEEIVAEIADIFSLNKEQREAVLERTYRKEDRIVKTPLWHRLLYRAADRLAQEKRVMRPADTASLTGKKEWMLTEKGVDYAMRLLQMPQARKEAIPVKSFETQKEVKRIIETPCPDDYVPFEQAKPSIRRAAARTVSVRARGFRQAVIESYDYACGICGLKINTPGALNWEVEAAHIVPHGLCGKDDIWNGIALCRLHHWAFDSGWFSLSNQYRVLVSSQFERLPDDFGNMSGFDVFRKSLEANRSVVLPRNASLRPHPHALEWHREHIFYR
jgi:hypothetical protein